MFILSACGTFTKIEHLMGHKINSIKFKVIEIIQSVFLDSNSIQLEINNRYLENPQIYENSTAHFLPTIKEKISKEIGMHFK